MESIKELEVISRYLELIPLSLRQIADSSRKRTDFACPILSPKKQLWDILSVANPLLGAPPK